MNIASHFRQKIFKIFIISVKIIKFYKINFNIKLLLLNINIIKLNFNFFLITIKFNFNLNLYKFFEFLMKNYVFLRQIRELFSNIFFSFIKFQQSDIFFC